MLVISKSCQLSAVSYQLAKTACGRVVYWTGLLRRPAFSCLAFCLEPGFRLLWPASCFLSPIPYILAPGSCLLPPASCLLPPGSWFLVPGSWFLVPGSWLLVPASGMGLIPFFNMNRAILETSAAAIAFALIRLVFVSSLSHGCQ